MANNTFSIAFATFQCRKRHCLMRNVFSITEAVDQLAVSMPQAALLDAQHPLHLDGTRYRPFQCRKRHCLMRNKELVRFISVNIMFQCRKRHCLMRNHL